MMRRKHTPGCGCCGGTPPCYPCWPDPTTHATLVLTCTYTGCSGYPQTVATTLTYHDDLPVTHPLGYWISPAQDPPDWSCYASTGYVHPVFRLICSGGQVYLRMEAYLGSAAVCVFGVGPIGCTPVYMAFPAGSCGAYGGIHATVTE